MELALANPDTNPVSAGLLSLDSAAEGNRLREAPENRARRGRRSDAGDEPRDPNRSGGQLVPRTQTALYTSHARRGIAVYQDTAGLGAYPTSLQSAGIDLYA